MSIAFALKSARRGVVLSLAVAAVAPAATYQWLPALGAGSWNDAANWQINGAAATQPPTAADAASFITTGGTTPTTAHTVSVPTPVSVTDLTLSRAAMTLDVPVGSSLAVTGVGVGTSLRGIRLNAGTLNATGLVTTSDFTFNAGKVNGTVQFSAATTGRLNLSGGPIQGGGFLFNGNGEVNASSITAGLTLTAQPTATAGELRLLGTSATNYGTLALATGGAANSVVSLTVAASGSTSYGTLYNYGALKLNAGGSGTNTRTVNGWLMNSFTGVMTVASGVSATVGQTLSNDGQLTVASGATLAAPTFTQNNSTAVTTVNGKLIATDVNYYGGTINGTIELAGNDFYNTRVLTLGTSNGTAGFVFTGGGTLSASSGLGQAMTVTARPTAAAPTATLKYTGSGFTNNGTITLGDDSGLAASAITLTADGTATGSFYNYGTLNLNAGSAGANTRTVAGGLQNSFLGKLTVASGVAATVTQSLSNDGLLTIASGASLTTPQFTQNNTNAVTTINGTLTAADVNYYGGQLNGVVELAGNDFNNTRQLNLGTSTGTATFVMQGAGTLSASSGLGQAMTVTARATSGTPSATLKYTGSGLTNNGTINLNADAAVTNSSVTLTADGSATGSFYNYGTLNLNAGSAGTNNRTISGGLQNSFLGKLNLATGVTAAVTQSLSNDGLLTIAAGASLKTPQFTQNNTSAVTTINGTLTAADVNYYGGQLNGVVELAGTDFNNTRQLNLGTSTGTATFVMQGAGTLSASSGLGQAMTVTARAINGTPSATLKYAGSGFTNNGTINLAADGAVTNSAVTLSADGGTSGSFYNYGTLNLNAGSAGTNTRTVAGGLQNSFLGKLNVAGGVAATVTQSLSNDGLLTIAAGGSVTTTQFTQNNTSAVTTIDGTLTAADVNYYGGTINGVVTLAGTDFSGTRRLTLSTPNGTAGFVLRGGGEVSIGSSVPAGVGVTGRATAATPNATLTFSNGSTATNNGVLTVDADAAAVDSVVTLAVGSGGVSGWLYNSGTINLSAGGTGTNARLLPGTLNNNPGGVVNVNAATVVGGMTFNRGTMNLNAAATFAGVFNNETGGVLNIGVTPTFNGGFNNYGTLNVSTPPAPPTGDGTPAPVEVPYPIGGNGSFSQSGSGTVVLSGANTYTGTTSVANPSATLVATPAAYQNVLSNAGGLDVKAGAFVFQYDTAAPRGLSAAVIRAVRRAAAAESAPSPVQTIRNLLVAGYASGFTTGQLRSTTATATRGLGYVDDGDRVTLKATFYGDADLDGGVSINDFNALAAHFGQGGGRAWADGDFDYDGGVSINDFNLLAANFGKSGVAAGDVPDYSGLLAFAAAKGDLAAFERVTGVPEPTGLAALVAACGALVPRRRRRS